MYMQPFVSLSCKHHLHCTILVYVKVVFLQPRKLQSVLKSETSLHRSCACVDMIKGTKLKHAKPNLRVSN